MKPRKKRILIVMDGSEQAFEAVNYISKAVTLWQSELVLLHVMDIVPDTFWDWEKEPLGPQYVAFLRDWESRKEEEVRTFMDRARQVLLDDGLSEDAVTVSVARRTEGIARDILNEAQRGYDAVAFGRRGRGAIEDAVLGSVANKILLNLADVPVCLVGGRPKLGKVLVGLDSSPWGLKVADFVGTMLASKNPVITLANVLRLPYEGIERSITDEQVQRLLEKSQKGIKSTFRKAAKSLTAAGADADRIFTKVISGGSRAIALLDEAKHGRYGTIVVGRRGMSNVADFKMGRVVTKLIQVSREFAVWIVN
ncbi:universal stress protein [Syntrophobacter fumaroxidans]|uniref:UspA domain protein n=1 Tax=Syntrophobacter fumaroxidans (strain DSM 10017 / MPOB) TaxID=335543 RepID=A0LGF4_SYNFM|nr:universal stress protein [Syntrophobacter fumaroxidans]ABK16506.1 UspA domain protein [Syntrophobacter fumaroxidans MPOB]